jgi:hypothetical protein
MKTRSIAAMVALAFIGGIIAFGWFTYDGAMPWVTAESKAKPVAVARAVSSPELTSIPAFIPAQPVVADSARTEAMLLSIATRRAVENGKPLGDLLPRLQKTFGQTHPKALATLSETGEQPLSNAALLSEFEQFAPKLVRPAGTGWPRIQYEFTTMFILRRGDQAISPSTARLARVRQNLIAGDVAAALRLVRAMPGAANGADWIVKAQKAVTVMDALDSIDRAAISAITAPAPLALPVAPIAPVVSDPSETDLPTAGE